MQRSKFHAKRVEVNGLRFDSKAEAERWHQLQALESAGMITELRRQVRFTFPLRTDGGRAYSYVADFVYSDYLGNLVVEDVKGYETEVSKIKRALMRHFHGIEVQLHRKSGRRSNVAPPTTATVQ